MFVGKGHLKHKHMKAKHNPQESQTQTQES